MKNVGVRLPDDRFACLQAIATADACRISDVLRKAIDAYLEISQDDPVDERLTLVEQRLAAVEQELGDL